jgi:hypothetical protein
MSDLAWPVEQRIVARACVAAFEAGFQSDDLDGESLAFIMERLAYVGTMVIEEQGMANHGVEHPDAERVPDDEVAALHAIVKERHASLEREAARMALARVVVACAERMLDRVGAWRRGTGDPPSSSDLEAIGAALDAFTTLDERLPRVEV